MKKVFIFLLLIIIFPINVSALEYSAVLTGKDYLYAKHENEVVNSRTKTSLYIDITNFDNVGSFMMYVTLDNNLVGINGCNTFNFISSGCSVTGFDIDKKIYYEYKYNIGMDDDILGNHFYTVTFQPKDSTPDSGTTEVVVFFENAKDRDGNPITIESATKKYTFKEWKLVLNTDSNDSEDNSDEDENKDNVVNGDTTEINNDDNNGVSNNDNVKSDNNYISKMTIDNYEINFDKNKTEYELMIDNSVNKLDINLELEDKKSSYEIIGANDLKANNYKVLIKVNAENDDEKVYTINIKIAEEIQEVVDVETEEDIDNKEIDMEKIYIVGGGVIAIILIIIIIISLISHKNNRKINKMLDEL